uniref:NADH dehydrogenase subunit 2 n=1 Tax=Neucentropus mandjuricus TaxID=1223783 RepID=UPI0021157699|nr:NADH dehydrogenase subunit 2 [Neucentropus mandjuricus]USL48465.1 NADH dehydrogenase subunit 2 [Neucentropus mandjuricus]
MNSSNLTFILINLMSTLYMMSSTSWINCWLAIEINLFMFIPIMYNKNIFNSENTIKYFLTQVLASTILMMTILTIHQYKFKTLIMNFSLLIKLGSAPFHYWFVMILSAMNWNILMFTSTFQKLGPLIMMSYNFNTNLMYMMIIMNNLFGMWGGLNQTSIKKLMAYSSINHLGWMMATMMISEKLLLMYFLVYTVSLLMISFMLNSMNLNFMNQIFSMKKNLWNFMNQFTMFMSMSGMPPFIGFTIKWLTINSMMSYNKFIIMIMLLNSLLNLYYYYQISYYFVMNKNYKIKFMIQYNLNWNNNFLITSFFLANLILFIQMI